LECINIKNEKKEGAMATLQGVKTGQTPLYEYRRTGLAEFARIGVIRFLNLLTPRVARKIFLAFGGKNGDTTIISRNIGSWKALEVMYTYQKRQMRGEVCAPSRFWENLLDNARSIRNRLVLVKAELTNAIRTIGNEQPIRILSIGSGSARPILEGVASLKKVSLHLDLMLIDMDPTAIEFSQKLSAELHVDHTTRLTGNFFRLERYATEFRPAIIELVGLLDYFDDRHAIFLLEKVFRVLIPGGFLITGNIAPNLETPFVTKGVGWSMVYRTPEELRTLLVHSGFLSDRIRVVQEPLGIHTLTIARKPEESMVS
jgi:SAM-dependent methyltransferase